jgi:hypothetical protein
MIIILCFLFCLGCLSLLFREPLMTDEQYELYFRTRVMGMTKSSLLSPEVQQALSEKVSPAAIGRIDPELDTWISFNKYQK